MVSLFRKNRGELGGLSGEEYERFCWVGRDGWMSGGCFGCFGRVGSFGWIGCECFQRSGH